MGMDALEIAQHIKVKASYFQSLRRTLLTSPDRNVERKNVNDQGCPHIRTEHDGQKRGRGQSPDRFGPRRPTDLGVNYLSTGAVCRPGAPRRSNSRAREVLDVGSAHKSDRPDRRWRNRR